MEALRTALATLVALEARAHELVDPARAVAEAARLVLKEVAVVAEELAVRIGNIETQLAAVTAHPALSVPPLELAPKAGAGAASTATAASTVEASGPADETTTESAPAPQAEDSALAGARDPAQVFGFDESTRAAP